MYIVCNNLYCKVYLNSGLEIEELYQHINCKILGELKPIRTIKMSWGEIDVRRNEDFCPRKLVDDPEDFVFWKYYLDIEPKEGADENDYIDQIAKLLVKLKAENFKVVASCDFEEYL